jgi:octaprenyl-diphosphate synthase
VTQLSLGELKDVSLSKTFNLDKEVYLEMIYQKTASLIEASAGAAAVIAGKPKEAYMTYGRNLGLAFQMIDDLLDITSDAETLGKPALHDFVEGKTTLPYIYLYEALDAKGRKRLASLHGKVLNTADQNWIKVEMEEKQILLKCYAQARELIEEAVELMNGYGETALSGIALEMIERDF